MVIDESAEKSQVALIAASLAARSDHPVSHAIAVGLNLDGDAITEFKALAGRGVRGLVNGRVHGPGNHRLIEERGQCSPAPDAQLKTHEETGRTFTLLATDAGVPALFAVVDTIKASSQQAVAELKALGIVPVMLTGDNVARAKTIAAHAGIDKAQCNLLPEDKLTAIGWGQVRPRWPRSVG